MRVKMKSKAIELPGVWALCSPSIATAADWIFYVTVLPKY